MEVRLLGPLEVVEGGRALALKGASERALLALLATAPGRTFTKASLIDGLWGDAPPSNPSNALQLRVSKLRKIIGVRLVTAAPGYRLDVDEHDVDATRFATLVQQRRFDEAFALWRGEPFGEFAEFDWARAEATRLGELHATAVEEHVDQRLAAGDHVGLVADLERLVAAAPLRERLRGQQMLALYRCGRTGDALAVYQAFRRLLDDELGVEPSTDLRGLEGAILREDPSLRLAEREEPVAGAVPTPVTVVIGRQDELERIAHLLAQNRLVTLTGPGGVGKTTLSVAAARQAAGQFPGGVWFVPLAALTDGANVAESVAEVLGVTDPDKRSARRLVTAWLAPRHALLVLDNCEHLADACAAFADHLLRTAGDGLRVLATSREALGVAGEVQVPIPPLEERDAVRLFTERAASFGATLPPGSDGHIRAICSRLDGMPLAVELAAARSKTLTPEQILAKLDDRFRLLTVAPRTAERRHQTLRATVDWSHDLLDAAQQRLFRRLAVFHGGWTLAAAEAICSDEGDDGGDTLDVLGHLVDRSLVVADRGRFRMLETLRAYAQERLVAAGEVELTARRHATFFTELAEATEPQLRGASQLDALARLRDDDANLRAAMAWSMRHRDDEPELVVRLGGALGWYWYVGRQVDGRAYLRVALETAAELSPASRARALQALSLAVRPVGCIVHPSAEGAHAARQSAALFTAAGQPVGAAVSQLLLAVEGVARRDPVDDLLLLDAARRVLAAHGDAWGMALADFVEMEIRIHHGLVDEALTLGRRAAAAFDALVDDWGRSAVLLHLGYGLRIAGRLEEAAEVLERAVLLSRVGGLPNNLARATSELAEVELHRGDAAAAAPWLDQCEQTAGELGNDTLLALALLGRATADRLRGDSTAAALRFREALMLSEGNDFAKGALRARTGLAAALLDDGDIATAGEQLQQARMLSLAVGDTGLVAGVLEQLARVAAADGRQREADDLQAQAEQLRARHGRPRGRLEERDATLTAARS